MQAMKANVTLPIYCMKVKFVKKNNFVYGSYSMEMKEQKASKLFTYLIIFISYDIVLLTKLLYYSSIGNGTTCGGVGRGFNYNFSNKSQTSFFYYSLCIFPGSWPYHHTSQSNFNLGEVFLNQSRA